MISVNLEFNLYGKKLLISVQIWILTKSQIDLVYQLHVSITQTHSQVSKHLGMRLVSNTTSINFSYLPVAPEQLNINLTSSLLLLFKETQASWSSDLQIESTHEQKEKQLLRLHHRSSSREINKDEGATPSEEKHQVANVQQGLALLHSVRFISQSRQRTKFIPFVLRNSTGLRLRFATLTSLPAKVLFNPSTLLQSPKDGGSILSSGLATPTCWIEVRPDEEKPFDFVSRQKLRHKVSASIFLYIYPFTFSMHPLWHLYVHSIYS